MAVPKKKTSSRRAAAAGHPPGCCAAPAAPLCPRCGRAKVPHTVCGTCGWYKGRQALDVE